MWESVYEYLVYILAVYGMINFILAVVDFFPMRFGRDTGIKVVLVVKNGENEVEGVVRSILACRDLRKIIKNNGLTIVDAGSDDGTMKILEKIPKAFEGVQVVTADNKNTIFT